MLIPKTNITPVLATRNKHVANPINISPENTVEDITSAGSDLILLATKFFSPLSLKFSQSQWQVSSSFIFSEGNLIYDAVSTKDQEHLVPKEAIENSDSGVFYWRVRYQSSSGMWSKWSIPTEFTLLIPEKFRGSQATITAGSAYYIDENKDLLASGHVGPGPWNYTGDRFYPTWTKLIPNKKFKMVSSDVWASGGMAIDEDGKLWAWGEGEDGQYGGDIPDDDTWPPRIIHGDHTWKYVHAGEYAGSFGIKEDGTLWAWGDYIYGYKGTARSGWIGKTTDQGTTWTLSKYQLSISGFDFVSVDRNSNRIIATFRRYLIEHKSNIKAGLFIGISEDGETWTLRDIDNVAQEYISRVNSQFSFYTQIATAHKISFVNNIWIIGASYGSFLKSEDNGETWTFMSMLHPSLSSYELNYKVIYGAGVYIAFGSQGVYSSTDLITWTNRISRTDTLNAFYDGTRFVATFNGTTPVVSTDGITWTSPSGVPWNGSTYPRVLNYINGRYIGTATSGLFWTSTDFVNWTSGTNTAVRALPGTIDYDSINQKWICLGGVNNGIGYSSDGVNWSLIVNTNFELEMRLIVAVSGNWITLGGGATYAGPDPIQVGVGNDWVIVEGFFWSAYGWKENGDLYVWGYNDGFLMSHDPTPSQFLPNQLIWNDNLTEPFFLGNYPDFDPIKPKRKIGWCAEGSLLVKPDGTLWAGGMWHNEFGYDAARWGTPCFSRQLGTDNDWDFVSYAADYSWVSAAKKNGDVYVFGSGNDFGSNSSTPLINLVKVEMDNDRAKLIDSGWNGGSGPMMVITVDNKLRSFGESDLGESGDGITGPEGGNFPESDNVPPWTVSTLILENVDWVETEYWNTIVRLKTGEMYGFGGNHRDLLGINEFAWYSKSFPHRIFSAETIQNTDAKSLEDAEFIWRRFASWSGIYDAYDAALGFDPWYYEPMRDWNWPRGFGWNAGSSEYMPFARYPSDVIKRDPSVPFVDWDWEDGLVWVGAGYNSSVAQTTYCLGYSHLKEITYLYIDVDQYTNLIDLCDKLFKNLEKLEVLEVWSSVNTTLDLSKFPVLDFSSIVEFNRSANVTVINRPPGFTL